MSLFVLASLALPGSGQRRLSEPDGQDPGRVCAGWHHRPSGAHHRRRAAVNVEHGGGGGESAWRGRDRRHHGPAQRARRRIHAADEHQRPGDHAAPEAAALRSDQGFRADHDRRARVPSHAGDAQAAGEDGQGVHRAGEVDSGRADLLVGRPRQRAVPGHAALHAGCRELPTWSTSLIPARCRQPWRW